MFMRAAKKFMVDIDGTGDNLQIVYVVVCMRISVIYRRLLCRTQNTGELGSSGENSELSKNLLIGASSKSPDNFYLLNCLSYYPP